MGVEFEGPSEAALTVSEEPLIVFEGSDVVQSYSLNLEIAVAGCLCFSTRAV